LKDGCLKHLVVSWNAQGKSGSSFSATPHVAMAFHNN
jgi:hypothetical protein